MKKQENKNTKKYAFKMIFVIFAIFVFLQVALCVVSELAGLTFDLVELSTAAAALCALLIIKKEKGHELSEVIKFKGFDLSVPIVMSLFTWCFADLVMWVVAMVLSLYMSIEPNSETEMSVLSVIGLVIIAPVCEEIMFRFSYMSLLKENSSKRFMLIFTSVFFAIVHFYNIQGFANVLVGAFVMGYVYLTTGNLLYSISIHFLHNSMCLLPLNIYSMDKGYIIPNAFYLAACVPIIIGCVVYYTRYFRPRYVTKKYDAELKIVPA